MPIGRAPLSYTGVVADNPPQFVVINRAPTENDFLNFNLGTIWLQKNTENLWLLTSMAQGVATWTPFGMNAGGDEFVTDDGTATPVNGVLNVVGGLNINTTGVGDTLGINLNTSINQPDTSADGTEGMYSLNGERFMHNYGSLNDNTFLGNLSGNLTNTSTRNVGIGLGALEDVTTGGSNTTVGASTGLILTTGSHNTFVGDSAGAFEVDGSWNIMIGSTSGSTASGSSENCILIGADGKLSENHVIRIQKSSVSPAVTGDKQIFIGHNAGIHLDSITPPQDNVGIGFNALNAVTTGDNNLALSNGSLSAITTGSNNIALGKNSGSSLASTESSNILIGNSGTVADNHVLKIGTHGSGTAQQSTAYIAGINGNTVANTQFVTINTATNQLGTTSGSTTTAYTPVLSFGGGSTGITYSSRGGYYNVIGNMVFWGAYVVLSSKGSSTGTASVTMPPFTPLTIGNGPTDFYIATTGISWSAGYTYVWGNAQVGGMQFNAGGSGLGFLVLDDTNFTNGSSFQVNGFYFTA